MSTVPQRKDYFFMLSIRQLLFPHSLSAEKLWITSPDFPRAVDKCKSFPQKVVHNCEINLLKN